MFLNKNDQTKRHVRCSGRPAYLVNRTYRPTSRSGKGPARYEKASVTEPR